MRSGLRISVGTQLILTVLAAIVVSWILSTGIANYMGYRDVVAIRKEMLKHPEVFPNQPAMPRFGIREFFLGPRRGVPDQFRIGQQPPGMPPPGTPVAPGLQGQPPAQNIPRPQRPPIAQNPQVQPGPRAPQPPMSQIAPGPQRPPILPGQQVPPGLRPPQGLGPQMMPRPPILPGQQIPPGLRVPQTAPQMPMQQPLPQAPLSQNQPMPQRPLVQPRQQVPPGLGTAQPPAQQTPSAPGPQRPPGPQGPPPQRESGAALLIIRAAIALALAILAGTWLRGRFSKPLVELAEGAKAFRAGNFKYRIPLTGDDEFAEVASAMNSMAQRVSAQITSLEDDAKRRQQFLADVAHELRSPVTTLRTMAGALQEGLADDPERRTRAEASLVNTSDRLLNLVSDLLELSKLDLQELPLHPQPVDLRHLAATVTHNHASLAEKKHVTLCPVQAGSPVNATVDPDRFTQVLDNLLDNAINYAGDNAEIRIFLEDGDPIRIVVADNGQGIPAKHLPYLFDPFYRANTARTPGDSHSGLGLRIARGLIQAHGGTLIVQSVEGKGTKAIITLPRR